MLGQHSQAHGVTPGPVQGQQLDPMTHVGPFQLSLFCDSVKDLQVSRSDAPVHHEISKSKRLIYHIFGESEQLFF